MSGRAGAWVGSWVRGWEGVRVSGWVDGWVGGGLVACRALHAHPTKHTVFETQPPSHVRPFPGCRTHAANVAPKLVAIWRLF